MNIFKALFSSENERDIKRLQVYVNRINAYEKDIQGLSDTDLKAKTTLFKERLQKGESLDDIMPEAFAVVREASKRTLGQRHFDVQLLGGLVLYFGGIPEMRTGEGKTLVATLPAYTHALMGKGVHVVTVNDYLSKRDGSWMGQIYDFLGLTVSIINHDQSYIYDSNLKGDDEKRDETGSFKVASDFLRTCTRKEAYRTDITYGTNNEFGFDFLRDNTEQEQSSLRQKNHYFAIVDEVDSILIDEARTPLIISAPSGESDDFYTRFASIATELKENEHYTIDEKYRTIALTDAGITYAEKLLGIENLYTEKGIKYVHHLETAVKAKALFHKDKEYVVKENEVVIVDEFTGRLQPGRRWSEGLHQAIEAKEHVKIQKESKTLASITFQNYFRMYERLSGMTGTAETSKEEFRKVYGLQVTVIPTHNPIQRIDRNDLVFKTEHGKFKRIAKAVKEKWQKGQPVLIGTVSIERNELLSEYLKVEGVPHEVLNAKNHSREGEIIAQAGKKGAVTIATNMAGRGVDIKLGGNPGTKESYEEIKSLGGLCVFGTERHDARRIDNQLRGRAGRQGDPGETQFFLSLDDSLMRVFGGEKLQQMMTRLGVQEDDSIENRFITRSIEQAQEKMEGFNFDARKHVLEFDDVLNYQRNIFYGRRRNILLGDAGVVQSYIDEMYAKYPDDEFIHLKDKLPLTSEQADIARVLILQTMDMFWVEHLETMDYMRGSVNLRAYGQRDPLVEYKKEGLRYFKDMEISIERSVLENLMHIDFTAMKNATQKPSEQTITLDVPPVVTPKNIGRNDPCPCGSGKKWKNCGLIDSEEHQKRSGM